MNTTIRLPDNPVETFRRNVSTGFRGGTTIIQRVTFNRIGIRNEQG